MHDGSHYLALLYHWRATLCSAGLPALLRFVQAENSGEHLEMTVFGQEMFELIGRSNLPVKGCV